MDFKHFAPVAIWQKCVGTFVSPLLLVVLLVLLPMGGVLAQEEKEPDPVNDCPKNLVCFTEKEAANIDRAIAVLQAELAVAHIKQVKHFGWTLGCGGTIGPELNSAQTGVSAQLGCGAMFGWRF